jgi:pullulanase/glycogen debranching enzyme
VFKPPTDFCRRGLATEIIGVTKLNMWPGQPYPLGTTYDGAGTNFAIFSEVAHRVELCLFDDSGCETRGELPEVTGFVWHGYLPNVGPGQRYGFRVYGPWSPEQGHRCNASKLLIDPYAKAIEKSNGTKPSFHMTLTIPMARQTRSIARRSYPNPWSSARISTGGLIDTPTRRGTRP